MAAEEDTFLVLSADPVVREPVEHPVILMTKLMEARPEPPGSLLVRGANPLKLLAVVHDLAQEPSWREEWIKSALEGILREVEVRQLRSIALPLLGTVHGKLETKTFFYLLKGVLKKWRPSHLKRIWLMIPRERGRETMNVFKDEFKT